MVDAPAVYRGTAQLEVKNLFDLLTDRRCQSQEFSPDDERSRD